MRTSAVSNAWSNYADIVNSAMTTSPGWRPRRAFEPFAKAGLERGAKLVIMTRGQAGALARSKRVSVALRSVGWRSPTRSAPATQSPPR